jgi:hypothetical protein
LLSPPWGGHDITVVVLSAIVPTAIAQRWFSPQGAAEHLLPPDPTEILIGESS